MKYLNLLFILSCTLISSCSFISGMDEEGKKMMLFVNQIVEEPDRMEEIIKSSEFYDKEFTEAVDSNYWQVYINNIKNFKNKGIQYHYEPDYIIQERGLSDIKGKGIIISSGNILYYPNIHFFFQYINDKWVLIDLSMGNNY